MTEAVGVRCFGCRRFAWAPLCADCRRIYLQPSVRIRRLSAELAVHTLFAYDEIEPLLLTKHTPHGWRLYRTMAKTVFEALPPPPELSDSVNVVAIDDRAAGGYSHTALLAREAAKWLGGRYRPALLRAASEWRYAGRSPAYRRAHPRRFRYEGPCEVAVWLVDDIVTTGTTLLEAAGTLRQSGVRVEGAVVLADAARRVEM